jgi:hypothetical protein
MRRRWETLRTSLMRASARPSPSGLSCVSHIPGRVTSMSSITSVKLSRRSFMTGSWRKVTQMRSQLFVFKAYQILNVNCFSLIAKWKKTGYEKLCCLRCIQTKVLLTFSIRWDVAHPFFQDMNYQGSTCICRVPKAQVRSGTVVECVHCGKC